MRQKWAPFGPEQAEAMAAQMRKIKPEQMAMLMSAAGRLQGALRQAKVARDWV